jgi:galactose oxidase-like protein/Kelch motif protein
MIAGGGSPVTNKVHVIDLSVGAPAYTAVAPLHFARMHALGVLLPDRTVLITGGSVMGEDPSTAVLDPEIYDPGTGTWTVVARSTVPRVYHGVALLLPDGRVITAGSNPHRKDDELRLELFHPPYLFRGSRPFIEAAPDAVDYGSMIEIETPQASDIKWVNLIRPMATTHSWDSNQRLVDVPFKSHGFCRLQAVIPSDANLAPPGWYMLSITDRHGIPSVAKWVHLTPREGLIPVAATRAAKVTEVSAQPSPRPRRKTAPTRKRVK